MFVEYHLLSYLVANYDFKKKKVTHGIIVLAGFSSKNGPDGLMFLMG